LTSLQVIRHVISSNILITVGARDFNSTLLLAACFRVKGEGGWEEFTSYKKKKKKMMMMKKEKKKKKKKKEKRVRTNEKGEREREREKENEPQVGQ
jgi:hypothetical protein